MTSVFHLLNQREFCEQRVEVEVQIIIKKKKKRKEKYAGELEGSNVGAMTARQVKLQRRVK